MSTPRRALLAAGLAGSVAALAGCRVPGMGGSGATTPSTHALDATLQTTLAMIDRYDATIAAQAGLAGRLAPLRAEHWTHATTLYAAMGRRVPSGGPSPAASRAAVPTDPKAALAALRGAERSAQADAATACLDAAAGYAGLLGSIAACRATHAEVLT